MSVAFYSHAYLYVIRYAYVFAFSDSQFLFKKTIMATGVVNFAMSIKRALQHQGRHKRMPARVQHNPRKPHFTTPAHMYNAMTMKLLKSLSSSLLFQLQRKFNVPHKMSIVL